jgi:endonuclease/exonuclease/phosphatase (EEP) superfamily protein YafD
LLAMLGRHFWALDLLAHFRLHYIAALLFSSIALLLLRQWQSGAFAMLGALIACLPVIDYLPKPEPATQTHILRAVSLNVWFRNDDLTSAVRYLESTGADVLVLQELSQQRAAAIAPMLKSFPYAYLDGADASDTVLFSKWPFQQTSIEKLAQDGVSAIRAVIDWRGKPITLIAAHLHWPMGPQSAARRDAELAGLSRLAQPFEQPLVILGDFNITPWSPHFRTLTDTFGLDDCALRHGFNQTWPSQVLPVGIRIDHCLATTHWRAVRVWTGPDVGSDHRPMGVELQLR